MSSTTGKGKPIGMRKLKEAITLLRALGFGPRQSNDVAGYVLLALLDLGPSDKWENAQEPLCGITPIIDFVARKYRLQYAPNTREAIRDEAVKYFVEEGLLIKAFIEEFCTRFVPGGVVLYVGDAENKFQHFDIEYFRRIGIEIDSAAKMPDVVIHDTKRQWLVIREAVTSAGVVDGKRRRELKELFSGFHCGLVFGSAFENRVAMRRFLSQISWETEVWIAEDPDHIVHFNGERFLGPYPDTLIG